MCPALSSVANEPAALERGVRRVVQARPERKSSAGRALESAGWLPKWGQNSSLGGHFFTGKQLVPEEGVALIVGWRAELGHPPTT